jgi:hypothetical protein
VDRGDNTGDDIKASIAARMNTLQKFSRDAKRTRTKILSFSKPRESENDSLGYEIVGPCPSIKIYSDGTGNTTNNISSEDHKVVDMLSKRSTHIENASSDVSTYRNSNINEIKDIINRRPNS